MFSSLKQKILWDYNKFKQLTLLKSSEAIFLSSNEIELRRNIKRIFIENDFPEFDGIELAILLSKADLLDYISSQMIDMIEEKSISLDEPGIKKILKGYFVKG